MIIPENNTKSFGIVYLDKNFEFLGFCKESNLYAPQKIDVYINKNKITTILTANNNESINNLYELDNNNLSFVYKLPEEFIDKKSIIQFINHKTQEELENSPCALSKTSNFIEKSFIKLLDQPFCKNIVSAETMGFFASEENLQNKSFVNFIKKLSNEFPQVSLQAIYFNETQKHATINIFQKELERIELLSSQRVYTTIRELKVFIGLDMNISNSIINSLIKCNPSLILVVYPNQEAIIKTKLNQLGEMDEASHLVLKELAISENTIKKCNNKYILSAWNEFFINSDLSYDFNHSIELGDFIIDLIKLSLSNITCKEHLINTLFIYFKTHGILEEDTILINNGYYNNDNNTCKRG